MSIDVVVGCQFGDEAKAKIVHSLLSSNETHQTRPRPFYEVVARYNGGDNAGHTIYHEGKKLIFHGVPVGIVYPGIRNVIGNGTVFSPRRLADEIENLRREGFDITDKTLYISDRANIITDAHIEQEESQHANDIGTTKKGIGFAYGDKAERTGVRVIDLYQIERDDVRSFVLAQLEKQGCRSPTEELEYLTRSFEPLRRYVADTGSLLNDWLQQGREVLGEGAQGTMLDVDHGSYPFCTSSSAGAGGVSTGLGVSPKQIRRIIGVTKAYATRVGEGPFVTEIQGAEGDQLRERGDEFGSTTGRPRRCGWLDTVVLQHAVRANGIDAVAITKMDVLDDVRIIPVCVEYELDGERWRNMPASALDLARCRPVYVNHVGWSQQTSNARSSPELPESARAYVEFLKRELEVPVEFVSVGPHPEQTIEF